MRTKKILIVSLILVILFAGILPTAYADSVVYVRLGGVPVGLTLENQGLYICCKGEVVTEDGVKVPMLNVDVYPGDYLVSINTVKVNTIKELVSALAECENTDKIKVGILRQGEIVYYTVIPAVDALTKSRKLGIVVQEGVSGVGTLTFVLDDGKFGALGHSVGAVDSESPQKGSLFRCKIIGVKMPRVGEAGELQGLFDKNSNPIAKILKNNDYGVFGKTSAKYDELPEVRLGNSASVKEGKAYVYTCVKGNKPQKYEIEIVKKLNQNKKTVKNMVIKVTDKRLLSDAGGIVQGMSGSPIIQGGCLVGAITHVFVNDSTMGYGLFIENMIDECRNL